MKKIVLIFLVVSTLSCVDKPKDESDYSKVLKHIKSLEPYKTDGIYVVDTLFYISRTTFSEDLLKDKDSQRGIRILDSLESIDKELSFESRANAKLSNINSDKEGKFNLYFSKQRGNIIEFEILDNKGDINNTHNFLTMFGTGYIYSVSVIDGKVKILKKLEVIYN